MDALSYSNFRKDLAKTLDKVSEDHTPILITRREGKSTVVMSLEDFKSYEETAYLMANPANAARLHDAIAEVEAGQAKTHELIGE